MDMTRAAALLDAPAHDLLQQFRGARSEARPRLVTVSEAFMHGMRRGVEAGGGSVDMADVGRELVPFALEGLGAAAATLDAIERASPSRVGDLVASATPAEASLHAVGAGWAAARLRRDPVSIAGERVDRASLEDGYGFGSGLFHSYRFAGRKRFGARSPDFDRGLGRAVWFLWCGDAARIAEVMAGFVDSRRRAVWCGVGVAASFTGGVSHDGLIALRKVAANHLCDVARGAALAAALRSALGYVPQHTELAVDAMREESQ
jgi:hypothetical protein